MSKGTIPCRRPGRAQQARSRLCGVINPEEPFSSVAAARAIVRLRFSAADRARMNRLAAKNRQGKLKPDEENTLDNYIRVGPTLGILQSKARRSLKMNRESDRDSE